MCSLISDNAFDRTYRVIKTCCEFSKMSVARSDEIFEIGEVMRNVWSHIFHAKIVIADCTGRNANVFYELGCSHCWAIQRNFDYTKGK